MVTFWHCLYSMQSRVNIMVWCLSVCLVTAWAHSSKLTAAGLLLWVQRQEILIYCCTTGGQQQWRANPGIVKCIESITLTFLGFFCNSCQTSVIFRFISPDSETITVLLGKALIIFVSCNVCQSLIYFLLDVQLRTIYTAIFVLLNS